MIYQRQAHFALGDTWMYFALSAPLVAREACERWFDEIKASLRLRSDD